MASEFRLKVVVSRMMTSQGITPTSSRSYIQDVYRHLCASERVPTSDEEGNDTVRFWGTGPNESYRDFEREIMQMWWGQYDYPPSEWPETYPPETRQLAAEIGVHPAHVDDALWVQSHDGLWKHYTKVVEYLDRVFWYHFCDLAFFVRAVQEIGADQAKRYRDPKTWTIASMICFDLGCSAGDGLILHDVLKQWSLNRDPWKRVIHTFGAQKVAHVLRQVPGATPHAVHVMLRVPEARHASYFTQMAHSITESWDALSDDTIRRILREEPWNQVRPEYRARLLTGESPQSLIAHMWEPVDRHTAHRWITETNGYMEPYEFYAMHVLGIPALELEQLRGPRMRIEKIVIDWYARKRTGANMTQERPWRLPDGTPIRVALMAIIDEVRPKHLVNGVHTDPDHVFTEIMNTESRWSAEELCAAKKRSTPFPEWPERTPIPGITQVRTWNRLIDIGNREHHCAGSYGQQCADGDTFLFEVNLDGAFSLFQITRNGKLLQHRAKGNSEPIDSHRRAVEQWVEWNKPELP